MQVTQELDFDSTTMSTKNNEDADVLFTSNDVKSKECDEETTNSRTKLYWLSTIALLLCYFGSGLEASLLGSTFSHMEVLLDATTQRLSIVFLLSEMGYLTGSFICGLLLDYLTKEILISVSCILYAVTTIVAPLWPLLYWFLVIIFLEYVSMGFLESAIQSYSMHLWKDLRQKESLVQTLHCLWSLGAAISPVLIRPFLLPITRCDNSTERNSTIDSSLVNYQLDNTTQLSAVEQIDNSCFTHNNVNYVKYAYVTIGCLILAFTSVIIVVFMVQLLTGTTLRYPTKESKLSSDKKHKVKEEVRLRLLLFFGIVLFFVSCGYVEQIPSGYLPLFAIEYFKWKPDNAAMLLTVLFICHFVGRLLGVFISLFVKPRTLLGINVGMVLLAYILMVFVKLQQDIIWISSALAGLAMSTLFPTGILVISEVFPITGKMMALFIIGYSCGSTTGPVVVGQIFDSAGPIWMIYILVIAAVIEMLLYFMMILMIRTYQHFISRYDNNNIVTVDIEHEQLNSKATI